MDPIASPPERLPHSLLKHYFLPLSGLVFFVTLAPSKPLRVVAFVSFVLWTIKATKYTTGNANDDYSVGCQMGGSCLAALYVLLLVDPLTEWRYVPGLKQPLTNLPFWTRLYWVLCGTLSPRGIDWSFQVRTLDFLNTTLFVSSDINSPRRSRCITCLHFQATPAEPSTNVESARSSGTCS